MTLVRLRHVAQINPPAPAFDRLGADDELTFLPMESVWPGDRLDISQRRTKSAVRTGYTRFQDGDVLVPKITPTFEAARSVLISGLHNGVGVGTTELHVLRAGPQLDPRFLLYLVNTHFFLKRGKAEMYGVAGQQRVPDDFLRNLPIPLPPLQEQRRIADFLDAETARIDSLQAISERHRSAFKERHEAQRSLALRGSHLSGDRVWHPMLGSLPSAWRILPLRRVVPRVGVGVVVDPSTYYSDTGVPFLRGSNVRAGRFDLDGVKLIAESNSKKLWRSQLAAGDVVVVRAGYPGRAAVVPPALEGSNCASLIVLKRGDVIHPKYLEAYFNSPLGASYVNSVRYGAAQEQINVSHVLDFMIPVPPAHQQMKIVAEMNGNDSTVFDIEHAVSRRLLLLAERRQALITAAVTGQIDVSTASGRGIED